MAKGCGASSLEDPGGSWLAGVGDTGASLEGAWDSASDDGAVAEGSSPSDAAVVELTAAPLLPEGLAPDTDEGPEDEGEMPALLALMDPAASFIAEMDSESEYVVGTFNVVRCNHGIV